MIRCFTEPWSDYMIGSLLHPVMSRQLRKLHLLVAGGVLAVLFGTSATPRVSVVGTLWLLD